MPKIREVESENSSDDSITSEDIIDNDHKKKKKETTSDALDISSESNDHMSKKKRKSRMSSFSVLSRNFIERNEKAKSVLYTPGTISLSQSAMK
jgi:hypothetical protein